MKRLTILLLTASMVLSNQACKKKKQASRRPAGRQSARPRASAPRQGSPHGRNAQPSARPWATLVASLPLESDALAYVSLAKLKKTAQWGLISGFLSSLDFYKKINKLCGLSLADTPQTLAAATAYHRADSTIVLSGPEFPADKLFSCLPKLAQDKAIVWKPEGSNAGTITVAALACCHDMRIVKTDPHRITLAMGEAAKDSAAGKKRASLGDNAKIFGLVDRVGGRDLWLLSLGLPPMLKSRLPSTNAVSQMRAMALGVNLTGQGLALKLVVDMRAKKAAADLAAVLNRYLPGLDRYAANLAQLKPIFSKLHVGTDEHYLTLSISLTWADLGKLQAVKAAMGR